MNKLKITLSLVLGLGMLVAVTNGVSAGQCSATDIASNPAVVNAPCTACLPPNNGHACGGQFTCCSGIGVQDGNSVYCNVSNDAWCAPSNPTPTPTPKLCPSNLSVTCGNVGPNVVATFNWDEASSSVADRYILRVNRLDGENPEWVSTNDHWYYVDNTVGTCNGTNCTALLDQNTPKKFVQGSYLGWSVQSYKGTAGSGVAGCSIEGGPFSCSMPQGVFSAACSKDQPYDRLSYLFTVNNITNVSGPFNHATFFLNTYNNQPYAAALRSYLGSPTWTSGTWQGYYLGRAYTLSPTKANQVDYTWSTATSGTIGSNQRTVDDLSRWMQANYPDVNLSIGSNLKYNNVQNDNLNTVEVQVKPHACAEGAGWGVDNVSVCWDANVQGIATEAEPLVIEEPVVEPSEVTIRPIVQKAHKDSFINRVLRAVSVAL